MENEYTFNFEFWDHKLNGILAMLNALCDGDMPPIEYDLVKENLEATNYQDEVWTDHVISGNNYDLDLLMAKNQHEDQASIVILITCQEDIASEVKTLSMFQGLFKDLELE